MGGGAMGLPPEPRLWLGSLLDTCGVFAARSVPSARGLRFAEHAVPAAGIEAGVRRGLVLQRAQLWVVSVGALRLSGVCDTLGGRCPAVGPVHSTAHSEERGFVRYSRCPCRAGALEHTHTQCLSWV